MNVIIKAHSSLKEKIPTILPMLGDTNRQQINTWKDNWEDLNTLLETSYGLPRAMSVDTRFEPITYWVEVGGLWFQYVIIDTRTGWFKITRKIVVINVTIIGLRL